jgi:ABC-type nitrate/sulfonate/bicarbonate transport system substrate-binding protein
MYRKTLMLGLLGLVAIAGLIACAGTIPAGALPVAPSTSTAPTAAPAAPGGATVPLRLGRFTQSIADSFVTRYMIDHQLVEQVGKEMDLDIKPEWTEFANGGAVVQALLAGQLDIGPAGIAPFMNQAVTNQRITPLLLATGTQKFVLVTHPEAPIHNLEDLKGKTVGTIVGSDLHFVLLYMLQSALGSPDPAANNIQLVNAQNAGQLASVPQGMDAAITTLTTFLRAQQDAGTVPVLNSYGYTESNYQGPLGEGAGIFIPDAEKSAFWPEGFYSNRGLVLASDDAIERNPQAVVAFLVAWQRALNELSKMTPEEVAATMEKDWGLTPDVGKQLVENELLTKRGWAYITEGDANVIWLTKKLMTESGALKEELTWDTLKGYFGKAAPLLQQAYEATDNAPAQDVFLDTSKDNRGHPAWQVDQWATPE